MVGDDSTSLLAYAGLGGAITCCAALELLGGAALLGGLAAALGVATGLTYLAVVGLAGLLATGLAYGYRTSQPLSHV